MLMNKNPQLGNIKDKIIDEIMDFHHLSAEKANEFLMDIRSWCASNVTHSKWSNIDPRAKAVTTYGLKHICERDLDKYVANNWIKAALYLEGFPIKKENSQKRITVEDMFDNVVNFHFKDCGV